ncbi:hypothetical protein PO909_004044 [Leuciscus waleckii]
MFPEIRDEYDLLSSRRTVMIMTHKHMITHFSYFSFNRLLPLPSLLILKDDKYMYLYGVFGIAVPVSVSFSCRESCSLVRALLRVSRLSSVFTLISDQFLVFLELHRDE